MPAPRDLQSDFIRAVLDPARAAPADVTSHTARRPVKRFDVYRNNVYFGLIEALAAQFPAIARLLGKEMFLNTAKAYIARHPPHSPLLFRYGEDFCGFLEAAAPLRDYPYLGDVARLEWLWMQAYHAPDAEPLGAEGLAQIPQDKLESVRLALHPSLRLLNSKYPVVSIRHTNLADEEVAPVELSGAGDGALIIRTHLEVEVRRLHPGALGMFRRLQEGATLGEANAAVADQSKNFNLQLALTELLQSGAIIGFEAG